MKCGVFIILAVLAYGQGASINLENDIKFTAAAEEEIRTETKIIGGSSSSIRDAPFTASVRLFNSHICGGVVISAQHVLTVAHCVTMPGSAVYSIAAGTSLISSMFDRDVAIRSVNRVYPHPEFDPRTLFNDIAVLVLSATLPLNDATLIAAALPKPNINIIPPRTAAYVSGWGFMREAGVVTNQLQILQKPTLDNEECLKRYGQRFAPPSVFCAGFTDPNQRQDACVGDHGGPLAIGVVPAKRTVYGLVTWALGCARGYPRVYVNISFYIEWINKILTGQKSVKYMAEDNINFNDFNDEYANLTIPELQQSQESQAENFIVGGQHGIIDRAPWTCRIRLFSAHVCGGAIISQQHVLTSAHCVVMPGMGIYAIIAGSSTGNGAPTTVTRIILHPEYHSRTLQHDIAVLSLIRPLTPHRTLAVARLPPIGVPPQPSSVGLISGWGMTTENSVQSMPRVIQILEVPVLEDAVCVKSYGARFVPPNVFCAGFTRGEQDACQGDTGGPFVDNNRVLWGIISWAYGCARPNFPRVFTSVSTYRPWIEAILNPPAA